MKDPEKMTPEVLVQFLAVEGMGTDKLAIDDEGRVYWLHQNHNALWWDPLADANDRDKLDNEIFRRFKLRVATARENDGGFSAVCLSKDIPPEYAFSANLGTAVCLAAAKALLSKIEMMAAKEKA